MAEEHRHQAGVITTYRRTGFLYIILIMYSSSDRYLVYLQR
nr:MAG TPA: hypothetical protein [Caudoviricetes sp.]